MIDRPFSLLAPFTDRLKTALFLRADNICSDTAAGELVGASKTAGLHQVHGNRTIIVRAPLARTEDADGMVTDVPGLALCVRWADCQNFVVYAPKKSVVGVLHAGWGGVIGGAIPAFFEALKNEWGIDPSDVIVGAGPSLCQRCADFSNPAVELSEFPSDLIQEKHADLQAATARQLLEIGVKKSKLERHLDCTRCHPKTYWTYRGGHRAEVQRGHTNMLAAVLL